MQQKRLINNSS